MDGTPILKSASVIDGAAQLAASKPAPATISSAGAALVKTAQEELAANNPNGACEALSLPNLCATAASIITVGYENDLAYTDHFFNYNREHLASASQDYIVVLDGLPEMAKASGYKDCQTVPASLQNIPGLTIVGLSNSNSTQIYSDLQYSSDALKKISAKYEASKGAQKSTWLAAGSAESRAEQNEFKSSRNQLLRDIRINLELHQIEGSFTDKEDQDLLKNLLKLTQTNGSSAITEISKGLTTLALNSMKKNKGESMKEEFSKDLQNTRAAQIAQLQEDNPEKTIIVRCGALILHSTRDEKTGEVQTGFMEPLSSNKDAQMDNGVLSLVMVRNNQKADAQVNHSKISMKLGDQKKVATTDDCIAIDYTLLKRAVAFKNATEI